MTVGDGQNSQSSPTTAAWSGFLVSAHAASATANAVSEALPAQISAPASAMFVTGTARRRGRQAEHHVGLDAAEPCPPGGPDQRSKHQGSSRRMRGCLEGQRRHDRRVPTNHIAGWHVGNIGGRPQEAKVAPRADNQAIAASPRERCRAGPARIQTPRRSRGRAVRALRAAVRGAPAVRPRARWPRARRRRTSGPRRTDDRRDRPDSPIAHRRRSGRAARRASRSGRPPVAAAVARITSQPNGPRVRAQSSASSIAAAAASTSSQRCIRSIERERSKLRQRDGVRKNHRGRQWPRNDVRRVPPDAEVQPAVGRRALDRQRIHPRRERHRANDRRARVGRQQGIDARPARGGRSNRELIGVGPIDHERANPGRAVSLWRVRSKRQPGAGIRRPGIDTSRRPRRSNCHCENRWLSGHAGRPDRRRAAPPPPTRPPPSSTRDPTTWNLRGKDKPECCSLRPFESTTGPASTPSKRPFFSVISSGCPVPTRLKRPPV